MLRTFKLLRDRFEYPAGLIVQEYKGNDFGCASTDSFILQAPHITVQEDDFSPFFTVPEADLEQQD